MQSASHPVMSLDATTFGRAVQGVVAQRIGLRRTRIAMARHMGTRSGSHESPAQTKKNAKNHFVVTNFQLWLTRARAEPLGADATPRMDPPQLLRPHSRAQTPETT